MYYVSNLIYINLFSLHNDVSFLMFSNKILSVCNSWTHTKLDPPLFWRIICKKYDNIFFSKKKLKGKLLLRNIRQILSSKHLTQIRKSHVDLPILIFRQCTSGIRPANLYCFRRQLYSSLKHYASILNDPETIDSWVCSNHRQTNYGFETLLPLMEFQQITILQY